MNKVRSILLTMSENPLNPTTIALLDENTIVVSALHLKLKEMSCDTFRYILGNYISEDKYEVLTAGYDTEYGWTDWMSTGTVTISEPMEIVT